MAVPIKRRAWEEMYTTQAWQVIHNSVNKSCRGDRAVSMFYRVRRLLQFAHLDGTLPIQVLRYVDR